MKIVGYHIFLRITRFVILVIRPDYQKFCLRSTPARDKEDHREKAKVVRTCRRRHKGHVPGRMLDAPVPGKRREGILKTRWKDSCKRDMESAGLKEEDVLDRTKW